jgi:hypothetical protein
MTFGTRRDGNQGETYYKDKGDLAERAAYSLLRYIFPDAEIQDVRSQEQWQKWDIDYIAEFGDTRKWVEVKYDKHLGAGNFCFEPLRIRHNTPPESALYLGWSIRSEATLFLMFHEPTKTMYCVYHKDLILGLQRYANEGNQLNMRSIPTDVHRTTINIYVPQRLTPHTIYVYEGDGVWRNTP